MSLSKGIVKGSATFTKVSGSPVGSDSDGRVAGVCYAISLSNFLEVFVAHAFELFCFKIYTTLPQSPVQEKGTLFTYFITPCLNKCLCTSY